MLRRFRSIQAAQLIAAGDVPTVDSGAVVSSAVCSVECAEMLRERWQNEELAEDIGRFFGPRFPVAEVANLIGSHRHWWKH